MIIFIFSHFIKYGIVIVTMYTLTPVFLLLISCFSSPNPSSSSAMAGSGQPAARSVFSPGCVRTQNPLPGPKWWWRRQRQQQGGTEGGADLSAAPPRPSGVVSAGGGASFRSGPAAGKEPAITTVWTCVQGGRAHLLLQVTHAHTHTFTQSCDHDGVCNLCLCVQGVCR